MFAMSHSMCATVMFVASLYFSRPASGEPMTTAFETVNHDAVTIVIGTLGGIPQANGKDLDSDKTRPFTIDTSLRGKNRTGQTILVKHSASGGFANAKPERMVAFIDSNQSLQWAGHLLAGKTIETGVILISGFYDYNAHLVTPGTMTLGQLKSLLTGTPLHQTMIVTLAFPDGRGGMVATKQDFAIEFESKTQKAKLLRSSVRCLKESSLLSADWGNTFLSLEMTFSCGNETRKVSFFGKFEGVDAQGAIRITATPGSPVMTSADFQRFLADPEIQGFQRMVQVNVDGENWEWNFTEQTIVGPKGQRGKQSSGPGSSITAKGIATESFIFDQVQVRLMLVHRDRVAGTAMGMMQLIDSANTECQISIAGNKPRPCTIRQIKPRIVK
jgi:hypothetical protein